MPVGFWQKSLEDKKVRRSYWAILSGELSKEIKVAGYLAKDPDSPVFVKQRVVGSTQIEACGNELFPLLSKNGFTLVRLLRKPDANIKFASMPSRRVFLWSAKNSMGRTKSITSSFAAMDGGKNGCRFLV